MIGAIASSTCACRWRRGQRTQVVVASVPFLETGPSACVTRPTRRSAQFDHALGGTVQTVALLHLPSRSASTAGCRCPSTMGPSCT